MHRVTEAVTEIRAAIDLLATVAAAAGDTQRLSVASGLQQTFSGIDDEDSLRRACRSALALYRGGMGSFQDVGSAEGADAVDRLRRALRTGASGFARR